MSWAFLYTRLLELQFLCWSWSLNIANHQPASLDWLAQAPCLRRRQPRGPIQGQSRAKEEFLVATLRDYLHFLFGSIWSMLDLSWTKIWLLPAKELGKLQRRNGHLPKISSPDLVVAVPFSTGHRHPLGQLRRIETEEVLQPRIDKTSTVVNETFTPYNGQTHLNTDAL